MKRKTKTSTKVANVNISLRYSEEEQAAWDEFIEQEIEVGRSMGVAVVALDYLYENSEANHKEYDWEAEVEIIAKKVGRGKVRTLSIPADTLKQIEDKSGIRLPKKPRKSKAKATTSQSYRKRKPAPNLGHFLRVVMWIEINGVMPSEEISAEASALPPTEEADIHVCPSALQSTTNSHKSETESSEQNDLFLSDTEADNADVQTVAESTIPLEAPRPRPLGNSFFKATGGYLFETSPKLARWLFKQTMGNWTGRIISALVLIAFGAWLIISNDAHLPAIEFASMLASQIRDSLNATVTTIGNFFYDAWAFIRDLFFSIIAGITAVIKFIFVTLGKFLFWLLVFCIGAFILYVVLILLLSHPEAIAPTFGFILLLTVYWHVELPDDVIKHKAFFDKRPLVCKIHPDLRWHPHYGCSLNRRW